MEVSLITSPLERGEVETADNRPGVEGGGVYQVHTMPPLSRQNAMRASRRADQDVSPEPRPPAPTAPPSV